MLSLRCDRLRSLADDVQRIEENNADWLWRDAVTLIDAATEMRHAAETIKSLSDNLSDMVDCRERARELEGENKKLRKLAQGLNWCTEGIDGPRVDCEHCPLGAVDGKPLELTCENMMRELGIEID